MFNSLTCLLLATTLQAQDLKSIFQTPKRDYDQFGIVERSNFDSESADANVRQKNCVDPPPPVANAQVLVRFGGDVNSRCGCGEVCRCRNEPATPQIVPYFYPYYQPIIVRPEPSDYYLPQPQSQRFVFEDNPAKCHPEPIIIEKSLRSKYRLSLPQRASVEDTIPNNKFTEEVEFSHHPHILNPVTLPEEVVAPTAVETLKKEVVARIEPTEISPNVKFVSVELDCNEPTKKRVLGYASPVEGVVYEKQVVNKKPRTQEVIVPRETLVCKKPRSEDVFLPYPGDGFVYKKPGTEVFVPVSYSNDPTEEIVYRRPRNKVFVAISGNAIDSEEKVIVGPHVADCGCCNCVRNLGEINEYVV